ncbi:MAG: FHA domain-containing protein [Rivularia sp. ALOHA_DT_140]|nr:FHA domain-containing protein [Rivularia sp. ALOHA_DT_140]
MIVCPNCNHPNPDGAVQCEACYTPLPATTSCPGCGASVQADASFCGQCGYNLRSTPSGVEPTVAPDAPVEVPPLSNTANEAANPVEASALPPTAVATPQGVETPSTQGSPPPTIPSEPVIGEQEIATPPPAVTPLPVNVAEAPASVEEEEEASFFEALPDLTVEPETASVPEPPPVAAPAVAPAPAPAVAPAPAPTLAAPSPSRTQLQQVSARLVHVKSDTQLELPQNLSVIHIGKANDRVPPDIDVSGFENSEVVSRIHADIRVEGDAYYIEDVGSSNGTYVNGMSLLPGNRHRLRPGDRVSMGKGDLVSFLFQIS